MCHFFVLCVHVCVVINLKGIVWFSRAFGVHKEVHCWNMRVRSRACGVCLGDFFFKCESVSVELQTGC